ncbi:alcohol dehydrogenase catalytic domain-containing protein [Sphingobium sp. TB-6]|nr:alcohol dehydrogenase catalytic domain-containing protein [Sphingobium sp. TB-6]
MLHMTGSPDVLRIEDVPAPVPAAGQALVKIGACGVAFHDIVERNGTYRRDMHFPVILGYEIAGTVVEAGADVSGLKVGDRVCTKAFASCGRCRLCRTGRETSCRERRAVRGGYAELAAIDQDALVPIPDSLSFEQACMLGPTVGVALNAVRDVARVAIGERVLVTGATGGVGLAAVRIAALAGATVVAVTRKAEAREMLEQAGADEVVVWDGSDNFGKALHAAERAVDVVIDTVGSRVFEAGFAALAVHGRYAFVGQLFGEEISINPARIFFKRAQLLGVGSVSRVQLEDAAALVARGDLTPPVACTFPLEDIARAHRLAESGALTGRAVITF